MSKEYLRFFLMENLLGKMSGLGGRKSRRFGSCEDMTIVF
jgi:hypothetical protein